MIFNKNVSINFKPHFTKLFFLFSLMLLIACQNSGKKEIANYGLAQGTTYSIKYISGSGKDFQSQIDSILIDIDLSMSLWVNSSIITRINRGDSAVEIDDNFRKVLKRSLELSKITNGNFDVTVGPLVRAWGFSNGSYQNLDSAMVDSLHRLVGYQKVSIAGMQVNLAPHQQLDFNAIAQGYSVDVIAEFLEKTGHQNYMVEVGGELKTKGENVNGKPWRIGIDKPQEELDEAQRFQIVLSLPKALGTGMSLATSGNYRKFFIDENGEKFVHTINPKTGYPVKSNLLSASIIASNCMDADGFATACMVVGVKGAQVLISENKKIEGYLIYSDKEGEIKEWMSPGFEKYID